MVTVNTIKLYRIPVRIELAQVNHGVRNNNLPLSDSDFKAYKGADTDIEFSIRNNDRQPVNLIGKSLLATIINQSNGSTVLQKDLRVIDDKKGIVRLSLSPAEVSDWTAGFYTYSVLILNEDGTQNLLAMDQNQKATGTIELKENALPNIFKPTVMDPSKFAPVEFEDLSTALNQGTTRFVGSAIPGDAQKGFTDGLHTFTVHTTNFTGLLFVFGSLEPNPTVNMIEPIIDWFEIALTATGSPLVFDESTGIQAFNFISNVSWVRFVWEPDPSIIIPAQSSGTGQPGTTGSPGTQFLGTIDRITIIP